MFAFKALGGASLSGEEGPLSGKPVQARRMALLALLAAHPQHTLTRDKLMAFLWPESDTEQGRHRLSESLYVLRKALGDQALISVGDQIRLDPARIVSDVANFRRAVDAGDLEEAVSLYAGPFLDGFFLKGSTEFDGWVESERGRLADEYGEALESLAAEADNDGNPLQAIPWWNRLVAHDPYNSRYALGLMHALASCGDPGNAVVHAQEHARFLRDELGADPTPEVLAFAESLRNGDDPGERVEGPRRETAAGGRELDSGCMADTPPPRIPAFPRRVPGIVWGGGLAGLVFLLWAGTTRLLPPEGSPALNPDLLLIYPVEVRGDDPGLEELGILTVDWIEEALHQVEGVEFVPSSYAEQYAEAAAGGGLPNPLHGAASLAGAGWAVSVVIRDRGESLEVRGELIEVSRGRSVQPVVESGSKSQLNELFGRFVRRLASAVVYKFDPIMAETEPGPMPTVPTIEALREFQLGYAAYDRGDGPSSFSHHMRAFELDSTFVRALVAAAHMAGGFELKDSLARHAEQRRSLLSKKGQNDLDVLLAGLRHDREGGLRIIRESARIVEGGFATVLEALFAIRVNLPGQALEATERYDPYLDYRRGEAFSYWSYRTQALHMLGRYDEELAEAVAGRKHYPDRLGALAAEARALAALGRTGDVSDLLHQARAITDNPGPAALEAGMELRAHGFPDAARDAFNQAVGWLTVGAARDALDPGKRIQLAKALYGAERWAEAQEVAAAALKEDPEDQSALGIVGLTGARLADSVLALESMDRLSGMSHGGERWERIYLMASISAVLGQGDEAMRLLYQAFDEGHPHGLHLHRDMNLETLRDREDFQALVAPKG
jgi:DNA-binding SARP family transcriptional activator/tetratricopeptide (TPR) repeat protein